MVQAKYDTKRYYASRVHSGKRNVTVWRPSVCTVDLLTVTHQGTVYDAASVHVGLTIRRLDYRHTC